MMFNAGGESICLDLDQMVKDAKVQIGKGKKQQALHFNMRRREVETKMGDFVLV